MYQKAKNAIRAFLAHHEGADLLKLLKKRSQEPYAPKK
jgi:hypothetical protein